MVLKKTAIAGTMESSDIFVQIEPSVSGIQIDLESVVKDRFGEDIENTVREVLHELQIDGAKVLINDHGALDIVIRARVETAARRAMEV